MDSVLQITVSIVGAGLSAYIGVRVALAEMKRDIANLKDADRGIVERVERLEQPYFQRGPAH
jgi:hypothetical protein